MHLQAYLMSGNEIAQILFLFFLPITVKVRYTRWWHIQLSRLCLLLAHSRGFVEFFPTGKEKAAMVWNWIGHYKVFFHEAIRLMKMKFILKSKFSEFLPSIMI